MMTSPAPRRLNDQLHDLDTIARRLNVATKTVRRLIVRGELGYHQVGRLKRVSDSQYLEYLSRVKRGRQPSKYESILDSYCRLSSPPAILLARYH